MKVDKEQTVHDLAIACVQAMLIDKVIKENKESEFGVISIDDLFTDATLDYANAVRELSTMLEVVESED